MKQNTISIKNKKSVQCNVFNGFFGIFEGHAGKQPPNANIMDGNDRNKCTAINCGRRFEM